ncbi:Histone-lysine N-methyltransferase, H3 lysine-9 specific SUVH4 [Thalictrum thalictroides]|uniref:Histone-lysine N-methyltransferase, H3 lysine-9 specific SUVH4 n=1 Tax=Thalictrum thalictroides TaxID=46969 RepID=A0A7J6WX69_THATH|nr:Histone-lysine N-methyltransferase, H3 lysine-9 specific SUVH4 [Thalictrum thalictroides]
MGESVVGKVVIIEDDDQSALMKEEVVSGRRASSRLLGKTRPFYGTQSPVKNAKTNTTMVAKNEGTSCKKPKLYTSNSKSKTELMTMENDEVASGSIKPCSEKIDLGEGEGEAKGGEVVEEGSGPNLVNDDGEVVEAGVQVLNEGTTGKSAHQRVKETIRLFNQNYLHFVQEEEQRCKKVEVKGPKSKKGSPNAEETKRPAKRPDLKAVSKMIATETILNTTKMFGEIPGVDVGHQFYSRAEMVVVGLHRHWLNGIDFVGKGHGKMEEYKGYTLPLAVSIVISGIYEDDLDNLEEVVYTGQGGNNLLGDKRQVSDQVMLRGNLALKNNMLQSVPVRVTRGHACSSSYTGKVYTYDGLYNVSQYWAEKGVSGFTVFKYRLKRNAGQPALTTSQVHFYRAHAPESLSQLRGLVCEDISGGQENIQIPASNLVDNPPIAPMGKFYLLIEFLNVGVSYLFVCM